MEAFDEMYHKYVKNCESCWSTERLHCSPRLRPRWAWICWNTRRNLEQILRTGIFDQLNIRYTANKIEAYKTSPRSKNREATIPFRFAILSVQKLMSLLSEKS